MRVDIEKGHLDCYMRIARDANKAVMAKVAKLKNFESLVEQKSISAEEKKERLVKALHEIIITAFSLNIKELGSKKKSIAKIKASTELLRSIIKKLQGINNYIEESLLREMGVIKKSLVVEAVKTKDPEKYLEQKGRILPKEYIGKVEHTVYELMHKIIFFDKKIIQDYKKKEIRVVDNEKLEIKDLHKILMIQTELLEVLEAKMPPASKIKLKLFTKNIFNHWIPMVFALLSSFEAEYGKEKEIIAMLKKNNNLREKIERKIKHVIAEKEKILKIKQERAMLMDSSKNLTDDCRQAFHDYISAASL